MRESINPALYRERQNTEAVLGQSLIILEKAISELNSNNICLAFSGGKDSIVAAFIANKYFGIKVGVCEESFCFPRDRIDYRDLAKKMGLEISFVETLNDSWLKKNDQYIFPSQKLGSKFYSLRQQAAVKSYSEGRNVLDRSFFGVITGRRNQENAVKKDYYRRSNGIMQIHPLRYWRTEQIWSFILDNNLPYPSIYTTKLGLAEGATPWCNINVSKAGGRKQCWQMVYEHDADYFRNHIAINYEEAEQWLRLEQQAGRI